MSGRLKFQLPQNLPFQVISYPTGRRSDIELLMLVLEFKVGYMLKDTQKYFGVMHEGMS